MTDKIDDPIRIRSQTEISPSQARRTYRVEELASPSNNDSRQNAPFGLRIVGQDRAVKAIDFGLAMRSHMFLVGPVGTGKTSYITARTREWARSLPTPDDWCYIANFDRQDQPRAMALPAGMGRRFQTDVDNFFDQAREQIRQAFDSESYVHHRRELLGRFEDQQRALWGEMVQNARALGFALQQAPTGELITVPLRPDGQPFRPQEFAELADSVRQGFAERQRQLEEPLANYSRRIRGIERDAAKALAQLDRDVARHAAVHLLDGLSPDYAHSPDALAYFGQILEDLYQRLADVRGEDGADDSRRDNLKDRYRIHVLVDRTGAKGAPVVVESRPTYANLFGRIEYQTVNGAWVTTPQWIKPGRVHQANGGFLILPARELLSEPAAYATLKRSLKQGSVRIENAPEAMGWHIPSLLQPEAIPVDVTVILVGTPDIFYALYTYDDEFRRIFPIKAEFAGDMPASPENLAALAAILEQGGQRQGCLELEETALTTLAEFGTELAEDQRRMSTRIGEILAVLKEADVWARKENSARIGGTHVKKALEERRLRSSGSEDRLHQMLKDGTLLVDTDGQVAGQVNGLAVLSTGDMSFGRPTRITARTYVGDRGIANIERQTHQSGIVHTKGVLTLSAFFAARFAQDKPLVLGASIGFEQMYEEVDGDSASSAELYALLSELADAPIDQGIAVTGSVNQKGEVQPIGGVNEKIEGFFRACAARGLTGRQGVIIPRRNVHQLMVAHDVVQAMRDGQFHIWAVDHVDQGISLLTGLRAGTPDDPDPQSCIMGRVRRRLDGYYAALKNYHEGTADQ